jgi:hypothetical protein
MRERLELLHALLSTPATQRSPKTAEGLWFACCASVREAFTAGVGQNSPSWQWCRNGRSNAVKRTLVWSARHGQFVPHADIPAEQLGEAENIQLRHLV